jgi:hypothetical protein
MISHKHQCIFIHIAKCAGTSVESAFGVDVTNYKAEDNDFLFGWDKKNKLWLQHATPQQLLDLNLISEEHWNSYYKFIIYRNSWSRAYSDYKWILETHTIIDSFSNYINKKGKFKKRLNNGDNAAYFGDHLNFQKDYFFLDGTRIEYDCEIDFDELETGFKKVIQDLSLKKDFFKNKINQSLINNRKHYSFFYTYKKKRLVKKIYKEDIDFFKFKFENEKNFFKNKLNKLWSLLKVNKHL